MTKIALTAHSGKERISGHHRRYKPDPLFHKIFWRLTLILFCGSMIGLIVSFGLMLTQPVTLPEYSVSYMGLLIFDGWDGGIFLYSILAFLLAVPSAMLSAFSKP